MDIIAEGLKWGMSTEIERISSIALLCIQLENTLKKVSKMRPWSYGSEHVAVNPRVENDRLTELGGALLRKKKKKMKCFTYKHSSWEPLQVFMLQAWPLFIWVYCKYISRARSWQRPSDLAHAQQQKQPGSSHTYTLIFQLKCSPHVNGFTGIVPFLCIRGTPKKCNCKITYNYHLVLFYSLSTQRETEWDLILHWDQ